MPRSQVANIDCYGFGAGVTETAPLTFSVRRGGRLQGRIENQSDVAIAYTLQVSADNATWADTTAAANGSAIADVSVPVRQFREFSINLRQGQDNFFRLQAVGGGRGELQLRGGELLQIKAV